MAKASVICTLHSSRTDLKIFIRSLATSFSMILHPLPNSSVLLPCRRLILPKMKCGLTSLLFLKLTCIHIRRNFIFPKKKRNHSSELNGQTDTSRRLISCTALEQPTARSYQKTCLQRLNYLPRKAIVETFLQLMTSANSIT